jgi:rubrerythrin
LARNGSDAETAWLVTRFANEEPSHATDLERLLKDFPENGAHLREEDDEPHMPL